MASRTGNRLPRRQRLASLLVLIGLLSLILPAPTATAALSGVSATATSQVAGATTTWQLAFTTGSNVPALGDVRIVFPTGFSQVAASATLSHGSATCTVLTLTVTCEVGALSSIAAGTSVTATISNMRNPTVSGTTGSFDVRTRNSLDATIESATTTATITAATLTGVAITGASQATGAVTTWTIAFTTVNDVATSGDVRVVFPTGFTPHSGSASQCGFTAPVTVLSASSAGSGQEVVCTITAGTIGAATATSLTITNVRNPSTEQTTDPFTVQTRNSADAIHDQHTSNQESISANTVASLALSAASNLAGAVTSWSFIISPVNALASGADIRIVFPSGFVTDSGGSTTCTASGKTFTASVQSATEVVCSLAGGSTINAGESFTLVVSNIRNPTIAATTSAFNIQLRSPMDVLQEQNTSATTVIVANALSGVTAAGASQSAGAVTTWTFALTTTNAVADGGDVRIVLPTGFATSSGAASVCAAAGKTFTTTIESATAFRCVLSGSTLSASESISLTVTNLKNPSYAQTTSAFTIQTRQATTQAVHDQLTSATATIAAHTLSAASFSAATQATGAVETWTVAFTAFNPVADGGEIRIVLPSGFQTSSGAATVCAAAGKTLMSTVASATEVRCILSGSTIAAGEALSLTLTNIRNPSTVQTTSAFTLQTRRATGLEVHDAHLTNTEAIVASTLGGVSVSAPSQGVGAVETWTISFTPVNGLADGADIRVVFPSGFATSSGAATVCGMTGKTLTTNVASATSVVCTLSGASIAAAEAVSLTLANIKNPSTGQTTSAFTIETRAPTTDAIQDQHLTNTEVIGASLLSGFSASAPLQQTGRVETWTIAFTTVNAFGANSDIRIQLPSGFATSSGAPTVCDVAGKTGETTTVVSSSEVICELNANTLTAGQAVSLTLTNLKNPAHAQTTDVFNVFVRDALDVGLDQHLTNTEAIAASTLAALGASGASNRHSATESWTFTITTLNAVAANGDIRIVFPSGFVLSSGAASVCDIHGRSGETTSVVSTNEVTCELGANTLSASESLSLTISNVRNPTSAMTTSAFVVQTRTATNLVHDEHLSLLASIVSGALTSVSFSAPLQTTGAVETWTVSFVPGNAMNAGSDVRILWPAGFVVATTSVCDILGQTGETTVVVSGSEIICSINGFSLPAGASVSMTVSSIKNPQSAQTTEFFTLQLRDVSDVIQEQYGLNREAISAAKFQGAPKLIASNGNASQAADYVLDLTLSNAWPSVGRLRLTMPSEYKLPASGLAVFGSIASSGAGAFAVPTVSGQSISITRIGGLDVPAGTRLLLTISGLSNPNAAQTGAFNVTVLDVLERATQSDTMAGLVFVGATVPIESDPILVPLPEAPVEATEDADAAAPPAAADAEPVKIRLAPGPEIGLLLVALGLLVARRRRLS